jgi:hypothetical protein
LKFVRRKKGNVGGFFFVFYVGEKSLGGKMWVVTFIRPVRKIGT